MLTELDQASRPEATQAIVEDNISAVGTIYFAWQLEALHLFDVADRLVELSMRGELPLGSGAVAPLLTDYEFNPDRLSATERQHLYARTFGALSGRAVEGEINFDFNDLWQHFVSGVAEFVRQHRVAGTPRPALLAQPSVRRAATALAVNLSQHGGDRANVAAKQLHRTIEQLLHLLQAPEVSKALGVHTMWEVIDRINRQDLGGPVDITRARTLAQAGMHITTWLAAHAADLHGGHSGSTFGAQPRLPDTDLITTVAHWLAASGAPDSATEPGTQPSASAQATVPMAQLPTLAADVLQTLRLIEAEAQSRASGVCALFHGPAGTGKTLAAQLLASRLARDLYRVDLSVLVSEYIGETESNLDRVFAQARKSGAVLLLDEADALFGKRSEVKDAHDRYADQVVNYLLQQIETYSGLVILASNQKLALDGTLVRRLRHLIDFSPRTDSKAA